VSRPRVLLVATIAFLLVASACGPAHIAEYVPKKRDYQLSAEAKVDDQPLSPGSLWHEGRPASMLFTDARALHSNDLLVVNVSEMADAHRSADTDLSRSSQSSAAITAFLGLVAKLKQDPTAADGLFKIGGSSSSAFNGDGTSGRTESLTATVPAIVRKVLPNGNLFIEGHRVILVNAEEQHFYISGVVRPIDIDQDNSVKSAMVADAEIEFVGRGVLTDNQRQGWLSRFLGWVWPF
jgi:flagellar L-ring protein precursor FlgH